jgi:RPA family protein
MSQTTTTETELQDRAETITTHLDAMTGPASDAAAVEAEITRQEIGQRLDDLVAHQVPVDEAVRTVVRGIMRDAGFEQSDLPAELARLAGYSAGSRFERAMLEDVEEADQWIDVVAEVVELWEPRSETIAQVGLLGDESSRLKFVKWESARLPELVEGETYRFHNVVTDEYRGRYSVSLNSATVVEPSETAVSAAAEGVTVGGTVVAVQEGSGLIKRCPKADCTRVLSGGRCGEHGAVEGEFDLRIKAIVDDGSRSVNAIFDAEATVTVSGLSMADAQKMAMDALDTSVVVDALTERVLGRSYRLTGPVVGEYFLVDDVAEGPADEDLSDEALEPAVTGRQPAQRMLAQEINASTHTFQESDEERAPVLSLSPTGVAVNRVLTVGALTEARDVGSSSEYWRGRVYVGSEPVFVYAGQYQPEAMQFLQQAATPSYVAVVGKLRSYEAGERVNVAIEPESIATVDEATREAWLAEAVEHTGTRIAAFERGAAQAAAAAEHYGNDLGSIEQAVTDAAKDLGLEDANP